MSLDRPKKRFSQNFLVDLDIAQKIVELLELSAGDVVFEIGAGRGVLTEIVANTEVNLFSFEIDRHLIPQLHSKFWKYPKVKIINRDFLRVIPSEWHRGAFKLIGNIPYDITSPVIDWIIQNRHLIKKAVITAQTELAERISSGPGSKHWAPISIFSQLFFDIRIALQISSKSFYPSPRVKSSTLVFVPKEEWQIEHWKEFEKIVRISFRQRRKLLANNLLGIDGVTKELLKDIFERLGFEKNIRAENVDIKGFIALTEMISNIS